MAAGAALLVASVALLAGGFANWRRRRLLTDVPTSKVRGVFIGLNEVKGTAESATPFPSQFTGTACVWCTHLIEEEHTRTVSSTDGQGHPTTRTEHYWKTRDKGGSAGPFELVD